VAKYLQRCCPKCKDYLGIVVPERGTSICQGNSSNEDFY